MSDALRIPHRQHCRSCSSPQLTISVRTEPESRADHPEEPPFVHPDARVASGAEVGPGTRIWGGTTVMGGARIGANVNIGGGSFVEGGARVGDRCTIKNEALLWEGVILEDDVFVGPRVTFTNDKLPRSPRMPEARARYASKEAWLCRSRVCRGASLGACSVILPGVTVGAYAMVGAGAVVTRDVEPHALVAGHPAKRVGWVCRCGGKVGSPGEACGGCRAGLEAPEASTGGK